MRRVFEGGAGDIRPGTEDRSRDSGDLDLFFDKEPPGEDVAEKGGEACKPLVCSGGSCVATAMSDEDVAVGVVSCDSSCDFGTVSGGGTWGSILYYISVNSR